MHDATAPVEAPIEERVEAPVEGPLVQRYWWVLALVVAQVVIALDLDVPVIRPVVALATLLGLPTLLLYRRAGFPSDSATARLLYAFASSLLGLILVALVLNTVLPQIGVDHPLQPKVLAATSLVVDLTLLRWRADRAPVLPAGWADTLRRLLDVRLELAQALAVGSVVLAVLGAVRLNNGAGGLLAWTAHALAAAALGVLLLRADGPVGRDVRTLAMVAASLLLSTSLRGWYITGHDIQTEYLAFVLTNDAQHWTMSTLQNAYNACLSVNILPTVLAQTTGLPGIVVFKLLLQLVFALVPVATYLFAGRFLSRRLALVATTFVLAFPTFYTDMPYLMRQEIAFFFLALLLLAATEPGRNTIGVRLLVGFLGIGVVLSHYSTTYLLLMGLVLGLGVLMGMRLFLRLRQREEPEGSDRPRLLLLSPVLILFLIVASLAWSGPATHTSGQASSVARQTIDAILGKGDDTPGSSDLSFSLFTRDQTSKRERLDLYVKGTLEGRKQVPARTLLIKKPGPAELRPKIVPATKAPLTGVGRAMDSVGLDPSSISSGIRLLGAGLMQLLLLVGLALVVLRRRIGRDVPLEVVCLSVGAVGSLGLIVLVPSLSVEYGVLRAFQQALLIVAPVMAVGLWAMVRPLGVRAAALTAVVPLALLLTFSGVIPSLLGGQAPQLALRNSGLYYDRFNTSDAELQGVDWLAAVKQDAGSPPQIISNKRIAARILAVTRNNSKVTDRLYPTLLTKGAYVFVDAHLGRTRHSNVFYTGDLITYAYPLQDLDRRLDLVYSSQHSRIYR